MRFSFPRLLVAFGLALLALPGHAQRVLLKGNVAADTAVHTFGPNRRLFAHAIVGYAPVVGEPSGPGGALRYGLSGAGKLGVRGKLRLSNTVAVGADVRYVQLRYEFKQNDQKILPTATLHDREWLTLRRLEPEAWVRLNAGPRGNVVGHYLDLGGWGGWVLASSTHAEDRPPTAARKLVSTEHGLPYVQRWAYGVGARVGANRYALETRYRFSNVFTGPAGRGFPEMPRWVVGLEVGVL